MAQRREKTGFDRYLEGRLHEADFAEAYHRARSEIQQVDEFMRAIDNVRVAHGMTKADLARKIGSKPEAVRRLFTTDSPNPTWTTVSSLAHAVGLRLALIPDESTDAA